MPPKNNFVHPAHWIYRLVFHYIEPLFAFGGVLQLYFAPKAYLDIATPNLSAQLDRPLSISHTALQSLYMQIVGGWLIIVFNDVVTLRVFDHDLKVWRCVMGAHLLSDIVYCRALLEDWGGKVFDVGTWDFMDWFTVVTTLAPLLLKVTFLLGIGVTHVVSGERKVAGKNN